MPSASEMTVNDHNDWPRYRITVLGPASVPIVGGWSAIASSGVARTRGGVGGGRRGQAATDRRRGTGVTCRYGRRPISQPRAIGDSSRLSRRTRWPPADKDPAKNRLHRKIKKNIVRIICTYIQNKHLYHLNCWITRIRKGNLLKTQTYFRLHTFFFQCGVRFHRGHFPKYISSKRTSKASLHVSHLKVNPLLPCDTHRFMFQPDGLIPRLSFPVSHRTRLLDIAHAFFFKCSSWTV